MNWLRHWYIRWLEFLGWSCFGSREIKMVNRIDQVVRMDKVYYFEHEKTIAEKVVRMKNI